MPPTPMVQIKTRFLGAGPRVEYSCDGLRDIPVRGNLAIRGLLSGPGAWNQNFKDWRDLILNSFPELFSKFSRNPQSYSQKSQGIPRAMPKISRAIPKKKSGGTVELAIRYQDPHPLGILPRWEPFPCNSKRWLDNPSRVYGSGKWMGPFFRPGSIQFLILVSTRVRKRPWTGTINLWLSLIGLV